MPKPPTKRDRLHELALLNPQPERVRAPWFAAAGFFDAADLRAGEVRDASPRAAGRRHQGRGRRLFGLSRPTFYQAEAAFARERTRGLATAAARTEVGPQAHGRGDARDRRAPPSPAAPSRHARLAQVVHQRSASRCTRAASNARSRAKKNADTPAPDPPLPAHACRTPTRLRARPKYSAGGLAPEIWAPSSSTACGAACSVLLQSATLCRRWRSTATATIAIPGTRDPQLVRLLANMVLSTQSKDDYAY